MTKIATSKGLTEEIVRYISESKNEPKWMLELRISAFLNYGKTKIPTWGPDLSRLSLEGISYFADPIAVEVDNWEKLPDELLQTFKKLGLPEAEENYLAGVGAQFDSGSVYHKLKSSLEDQGVIFENMDVALQKYPELVREYFMTTCVKTDEHKFAMLHAACWSGGTFIYIPKNLEVEIPLQAYFRMNRMSSAQFEHTIIVADEGSKITYIEGCSAPQYTSSSLHAGCVEIFVKKDATVKYISVENWSKNTYNLNTKKALVFENGKIEWIGGNMGAGVSMLYPCSVLLGSRASSESLSIVLAGKEQIQDVGSKVVHVGEDTSSVIRSRSVSRDGGISSYRGIVCIENSAKGSSSSVSCDALILDRYSKSLSIPAVSVKNAKSHIAHEARVGRLDEEKLFYLRSRGLSEHEATRLLVGGFMAPIAKALPLEYAIEFNRLLDLEF